MAIRSFLDIEAREESDEDDWSDNNGEDMEPVDIGSNNEERTEETRRPLPSKRKKIPPAEQLFASIFARLLPESSTSPPSPIPSNSANDPRPIAHTGLGADCTGSCSGPEGPFHPWAEAVLRRERDNPEPFTTPQRAPPLQPPERAELELDFTKLPERCKGSTYPELSQPSRFIIREAWAAWAAWERDEAPESSLIRRRELAPGEWVTVRHRGQHHGDTGIVYRVDRTKEGHRGYWVFLVPRLPTDHERVQSGLAPGSEKPALREKGDAPSKRKRKREENRLIKWSLNLFNPKDHKKDEVTRLQEHATFQYNKRTYSHGLVLRFYRETSLDPRFAILSAESLRFFTRSRHPFILQSTLPCLEHWKFEYGEAVTVKNLPGINSVILEVAENEGTCHVEVGERSLDTYSDIHVVPMRLLLKVVRPGDYVRVVAGVHIGLEGLVTQLSGAEVHVFELTPDDANDDAQSPWQTPKGKLARVQHNMDAILHVNSVKVIPPPFIMDHGPWYDVRVVVESEKDSHYDVYHGCVGVIKRVRRTGPNKLGVTVYLFRFDSSTEFELRHLLDQRTRQPLLLAHPLPEYYHQYRIDPELDKMYTGRPPWFGVRVSIIGGHHKGTVAIVKDVNSQSSPMRHIKLRVELQQASEVVNRLEWVSLKHVLEERTKKPLYLYWPVLTSSIFAPLPHDLVPERFWAPQKKSKLNGRWRDDNVETPEEPLHLLEDGVEIEEIVVENNETNDDDEAENAEIEEDLEMEDPWSVWNPNHRSGITHSIIDVEGSRSRISDESTYLWDRTVFSPCWSAGSIEYEMQARLDVLFDSLPAHLRSPSPPPLPSPSAPGLPAVPTHWFLHPKLVNMMFQVKVMSKEIFIETSARPTGIVAMRKKGRGKEDVPHCDIVKAVPRNFGSQSLMVIIGGKEDDIGKVVRGIYYFFNQVHREESKWWMAVTVNPQFTWMRAEAPQFLDLDPEHLAIVDEPSENRKKAKETFETNTAAGSSTAVRFGKQSPGLHSQAADLELGKVSGTAVVLDRQMRRKQSIDMDISRLDRILKPHKTTIPLKDWSYRRGFLPRRDSDRSAYVGFSIDALARESGSLQNCFQRLARYREAAIVGFGVTHGPNLPGHRHLRGDPAILEALSELLEILGYHCLKASADAESLLAQWAYDGHIDAIIATNTLPLALGAPVVLRESLSTSNGDVEVDVYDAAVLKRATGINRAGMVLILLLSGYICPLGVTDSLANDLAAKTKIGDMLMDAMDTWLGINQGKLEKAFYNINLELCETLETNPDRALSRRHAKLASYFTWLWPREELALYLYNKRERQTQLAGFAMLRGWYDIVDVARLRLWGVRHLGWEHADSSSIIRDGGLSIWQAVMASVLLSPVAEYDPEKQIIKARYLRAKILSETAMRTPRNGLKCTRFLVSLKHAGIAARLPITDKSVSLRIPDLVKRYIKEKQFTDHVVDSDDDDDMTLSASDRNSSEDPGEAMMVVEMTQEAKEESDE
ncbi:hypothetical protein VNI00_012897 [Paramarasmius palmivorus]|uniref:KOW domain-containing protein n=1 Tax=Paramarasmius palmivorus TaxID=297713 RepID=A0AAW0C2S5_9AGAR